MRVTPELTFEEDVSIEHGAHIAGVLKRLENERAERGITADGESEDGNE